MLILVSYAVAAVAITLNTCSQTTIKQIIDVTHRLLALPPIIYLRVSSHACHPKRCPQTTQIPINLFEFIRFNLTISYYQNLYNVATPRPLVCTSVNVMLDKHTKPKHPIHTPLDR